MKVAICTAGGEREFPLPLLEQFQREYGVQIRAERFDSGSALLTCPQPPDVALLDGDLPDGLEVGARLRRQAPGCRIILFARDRRAALLGYAIHPEGFLTKPVDYRSLRAALERCRPCWQGEARSVEIVANRVAVRILCCDVDYIEVQGRQLTLHGRYGQVQCRMPLARIRQQLEGAPFLSCHRSYLVNLFRVHGREQDRLRLQNGGWAPVSADRQEDVFARLRQFEEDNPLWAEAARNSAGNS